jgi:hypothetical protein
MQSPQTRASLPENHPYNVVSELLRGSDIVGGDAHLGPAVERCVATLERRAPEAVRLARKGGTDIEYLGIASLFSVPRFYEGVEGNDWVLLPADRREDAIMPRHVIREIRQIPGAGLDGALVYIAHEIDPAISADLRAEAAAGRREISHAHAAELIGSVPPPVEAIALGNQLAQQSEQMVNAARQTLRVAGTAVKGAVAVSGTLVAGALSSVATLDPIVLVAQPAISEKPGAPAAWFLVARWDW